MTSVWNAPDGTFSGPAAIERDDNLVNARPAINTDSTTASESCDIATPSPDNPLRSDHHHRSTTVAARDKCHDPARLPLTGRAIRRGIGRRSSTGRRAQTERGCRSDVLPPDQRAE